MDIEQWLCEIEDAYIEQSSVLDEQDKAILRLDVKLNDISRHQSFILNTHELLFAYVFKKALNKKVFGDKNCIINHFGKSLEENYGITEGPFLDLAYSYWTFNLETDDLVSTYHTIVLTQLLLKVEFDIASVFFPTPGALMIDIEKRKKTQKTIFETFIPEFDIDRYFDENPILKIEKARQQKRNQIFLVIISIIVLICVLFIICKN